MLKRVLFLLDAARALNAERNGGSGRPVDPRMRIVMSAIDRWRAARPAGSGGQRRSGGTLGFVLDTFRAFRASRGAQASGASSSRVGAILDAVKAYRAARSRGG